MEFGGGTIILSTPEELLPLITEAVRLASNKNVQSTSEGPVKKLLALNWYPPKNSRILVARKRWPGIYELWQACLL